MLHGDGTNKENRHSKWLHLSIVFLMTLFAPLIRELVVMVITECETDKMWKGNTVCYFEIPEGNGPETMSFDFRFEPRTYKIRNNKC